MIKDLVIIQRQFAVWAAPTAASASPKCQFKAADGVAILEG